MHILTTMSTHKHTQTHAYMIHITQCWAYFVIKDAVGVPCISPWHSPPSKYQWILVAETSSPLSKGFVCPKMHVQPVHGISWKGHGLKALGAALDQWWTRFDEQNTSPWLIKTFQQDRTLVTHRGTWFTDPTSVGPFPSLPHLTSPVTATLFQEISSQINYYLYSDPLLRVRFWVIRTRIMK